MCQQIKIYTYRKTQTHSFTLLRSGGSAVWNVKNFFLFSCFQRRFVCSAKNWLEKKFFPIMCRAVVYSSLSLYQFQLYFFGGIGEIITQFRNKYIYWKSKHLNSHVLIIIHSYISSCGGTTQVQHNYYLEKNDHVFEKLFFTNK